MYRFCYIYFDKKCKNFLRWPPESYSMLYAICYHLYNLKNVKKILGGVLILVKLPATLLKVTLLYGCFPHFLNCANGTKLRNAPLCLHSRTDGQGYDWTWKGSSSEARNRSETKDLFFLHGAHRLIDFKGFRNLPNCLDFLVFNDNTVTRYIQGWKIPLIILSACSANSFLLLMKAFPDLTSRYTAFFKVPPIPSTGPFWWRRSL